MQAGRQASIEGAEPVACGQGSMALLPRLLTDSPAATFPAFPLQAWTMPSSEEILYSERYSDDVYGKCSGCKENHKHPEPMLTRPAERTSGSSDLLTAALACTSLCTEYRHVILPADIASRVPKNRLMSEVRTAGAQWPDGCMHPRCHSQHPLEAGASSHLPSLRAARVAGAGRAAEPWMG